ncbi:SHOCT domain-containing protein [Micromonospora zhanjiangensis]|uniref:SHOCT domain-containing protein n=1 Tax=Micromonospora zhanjiangensis TaxID=1522057 RepID=A0ABV8KRE2_9ACTN
MLAHVASCSAYAVDQPGWGPGCWDGSPGWWLVFPIAFWVIVLSVLGYVLYRRSPKQSARAAAERTLAERYARGEIDTDELLERRNALRDAS